MSANILSFIGNTPLVEITRLNPNPRVRIFAKLEYFNPGGSIKDRPALAMIEAGMASGELTPDKTVIEATSGNTGIGLALVCAVKGFRLLLTMSEAASQERQKILKARGAQILLTPGHLGTDGAIEEAYRLARENPDAYFMTDQFNNPANWEAHYRGTGPEIWEQTQGLVTVAIATMGTTGTLMGIARALKERNPAIRVIGVEPYLGHKIQGLKNLKEAYVPGIFDKNSMDEKINIEDEQAFEMARRLAREEGLFVGMSSGAAMAVACKVAQELTGGVIVAIFPDSGERYLSTTLFDVKEKCGIRLYNTLTRSADVFEPLSPPRVGIYACGPTAHGRLNLSECRRFVFTDLLRRYLTFRGFDVNLVMNITDMDDKTIAGSEKAGMDLASFTKKHIECFWTDCETLGIGRASTYPRTSEHTQDMARMAGKLMDKGVAYEKLRSLYCDISRLPKYGELSGVDVNKIRVGHSVDMDDYEKDNPRDFTLFKRTQLSELKRGIFVKTPWGNARPSWHIQCAAMAMKYLGESFDIHASSRDLVFPHHENVMAISRALTGKPLARYWMHCDRVTVEGKKMDPAVSVTLSDLLDMGYSGKQIRYWLLATHYRKPIAFSRKRLDDAQNALARLDRFVDALSGWQGGKACPEIDQIVYDIKAGFTQAMDEDLAISSAMAHLFSMVKKVNCLMAQNAMNEEDAEKISEALKKIDTVISVLTFPEPLRGAEISRLCAERDTARKARDFSRADAIREELVRLGVAVRDGKPD